MKDHGDEPSHTREDSVPGTKAAAPPDGGWGWVVCFACFMTHVLTDGTFYSFGIIFVELLDYYQDTKGSTAVIASLSFGVCLLSGPLNAAMSNYFGFRKTTLFGTILMTTSLICSIFSPNVFCLYITFGIAGWGFGMVYLCSIVCLTMYFEKRRSLAVGLGVSGSGIGTFIFGLLTKTLIDRYTWKGAILIQGGLMLNCLACGLVYLPLDHVVNRRDRGVALLSTEHSAAGDQIEMARSINRNEDFVRDNKHALPENEHMNKDDDDDNQLQDNMTVDISDVTLSKLMTNRNNDDIDYRVEALKEPIKLANDEQRMTADGDNSVSHTEKRFLDEMIIALKQSFNFSMFRNISYLLFIVSTIFYSIGYYIPYVYLPDKAEIAGIDSYLAAILISSIGITNTAGRIIFGFISDKKCINRLLLYNTALVICGVGTILCPFLNTFGALLTYTVIFGLFSGVTISLTSVIVADLVGTDMLADAFGVMSFFAGIATFVGPPLGGWLFDVTNSYDWPFVCAGIAITFGGALLYVLPLLGHKSAKPSIQP